MNAAIRQYALELGFDLCRFTSAEPPATHLHFQNWVRQGHHGEMQWLERGTAKRSNPQQILEQASSIICLAASYAEQTTDHPRANAKRQRQGFIARYARFTDYHDVLMEKLKRLSQRVNQLGGANAKSLWYTDTGPILERDLAQRAGLGFIGKHTNLISRHLGNWFLLAEVITTVELLPDAPETNHCGTCSRCLTSCPTGAIAEPFVLDARKCISYLTIELKGAIPEALRPAIGDRIFGCDDCLAVCPWNRFAREGRIMKCQARNDVSQHDLIHLLSLDESGFKACFAGTPIMRTKRRGLLRNVCVALGNQIDARALPALEKAAQDPEPLIAEHATWAIRQIRKP